MRDLAIFILAFCLATGGSAQASEYQISLRATEDREKLRAAIEFPRYQNVDVSVRLNCDKDISTTLFFILTPERIANPEINELLSGENGSERTKVVTLRIKLSASGRSERRFIPQAYLTYYPDKGDFSIFSQELKDVKPEGMATVADILTQPYFEFGLEIDTGFEDAGHPFKLDNQPFEGNADTFLSQSVMRSVCGL